MCWCNKDFFIKLSFELRAVQAAWIEFWKFNRRLPCLKFMYTVAWFLFLSSLYECIFLLYEEWLAWGTLKRRSSRQKSRQNGMMNSPIRNDTQWYTRQLLVNSPWAQFSKVFYHPCAQTFTGPLTAHQVPLR